MLLLTLHQPAKYPFISSRAVPSAVQKHTDSTTPPIGPQDIATAVRSQQIRLAHCSETDDMAQSLRSIVDAHAPEDEQGGPEIAVARSGERQAEAGWASPVRA